MLMNSTSRPNLPMCECATACRLTVLHSDVKIWRGALPNGEWATNTGASLLGPGDPAVVGRLQRPRARRAVFQGAQTLWTALEGPRKGRHELHKAHEQGRAAD